ncbi:hypothetical protein HBI18_148420 [Parastagonospora nodorum]|nr:hypothetical protein HBI78_040290 [Parastagonospora nodorum]KAH4984513.1 hypothetical protein HBI76_137360 [Parastagonospora nodorum]KAH5213379.1 hypothetical protein HBH77_068210 [Parastagonospora nodorum]KAH5634158.1 hypothetical protein HBI51_175340 [Parastagonospora nodorum]KAH5721598.1 hypothetical protein HBI18_148420 [Parastagonospora nodorum]
MKAEDCTTSACSRHVRYMNAPYTLHPRRIAASSDMGPCQQTLVDYCRCGGYASSRHSSERTKGEGAERLTEKLIGWLDLVQLRRNFEESSG